MKYQLLHATSFDPGDIAGTLTNESIEAKRIRSPGDLVVGDRPTILVLDPGARQLFPLAKLRRFVDGGGAVVVLGAEGEEYPDGVPDHLMSALLHAPYHQKELLIALRTAFRDAATRIENSLLAERAQARTRELDELTRIGVALNTERDYDTLQSLVLSQARRITASDAYVEFLDKHLKGTVPTE